MSCGRNEVAPISERERDLLAVVSPIFTPMGAPAGQTAGAFSRLFGQPSQGTDPRRWPGVQLRMGVGRDLISASAYRRFGGELRRLAPMIIDRRAPALGVRLCPLL